MTKRTRKSIVQLTSAAIAAMLLLASGGAANAGSRVPHTATLWWVIFNNPDNCLSTPFEIAKCGAVDVFGQPFLDSVEAGEPDPSLIAPNLESEIGVLYATGGTTYRNGKIRLTASIYRTEQPLDLAGEQVVDPMGLGTGFTKEGAEVHLIVRDHGPRVRVGEFLQITNFLEPYCSDPLLLFEGGENTCADVQFSVFTGMVTTTGDMVRFKDGEAVRGSSATLVRQGDMLQAVVETRLKTKRKR